MINDEEQTKKKGSIATVASGYLLANRYEMVQSIAYGGMAQVWVATDTLTHQRVAVKILHTHLADDEQFIVRFRREAKAAFKLSHPSIVSISDSISENGIEAIVMELIEGPTLREALDGEKQLTAEDVLRMGADIADALHEAHRAGIIHRDIKPANIMIGKQNKAYITDFGIAKASEDTDLTATGMLLGTAKYLAPEQVTGNNADSRSDIYSLAVVLFEALTGEPPFVANTEAATALARLQDPPPLVSSLKPNLLGEIDHVINKALKKEPEKRYQDATDFKKALDSIDVSRIGQRMPRPYDPQSEPEDDQKLGRANNDHLAPAEVRDLISKPEGPLSTNWIVPAIVLFLILASLILATFLLVRSINQLDGDEENESASVIHRDL